MEQENCRKNRRTGTIVAAQKKSVCATVGPLPTITFLDENLNPLAVGTIAGGPAGTHPRMSACVMFFPQEEGLRQGKTEITWGEFTVYTPIIVKSLSL